MNWRCKLFGHKWSHWSLWLRKIDSDGHYQDRRCLRCPTYIRRECGIPMTAEEFDKKFDAGEDMSAHVDWSKATRANGRPIR